MSLLIPVAVMAGLVISLILVLTLASRFFKVDEDPLIEAVNQCLPQTQCAQCGYPGCRPYAQAIVQDNEEINRCPPGGDETIQALASLLAREVLPLNPDNGLISDPKVVKIREADCIGCTLCIQACPVDAIIGAPRLMHTVLEDLCTGCDLCLPVCPMDCIEVRHV